MTWPPQIKAAGMMTNKSLIQQAMREGLDVNPKNLETFPDLKNMKSTRAFKGWENIRPMKTD